MVYVDWEARLVYVGLESCLVYVGSGRLFHVIFLKWFWIKRDHVSDVCSPSLVSGLGKLENTSPVG